MKRHVISLSRQYQAALQQHLQRGHGSRMHAAHRLGQRAVVLGLETLDLAGVHKAALTTLTRRGASAADRGRMLKEAGIFFTEAIVPIEKTHRAGVQAAARLDTQNKTLHRRTAQLTVANRHLKQAILNRKTAEATLKKSGRRCSGLLRDSQLLQRHLQELTHQILSAQEEDRGRISHNLQDDIAQTLLGINVRLLTLKKDSAARSEDLAKEIASTQRLVDNSVKAVDRFGRKLGRST